MTVQQNGDAVIIQGRDGLDQIAKCVLAQIREVQRNGYSVEPYAQLLRTIHAARMSDNGHELASDQLLQSHSESQDVDDWIDVTAAADVLAVSPRQVRRLAPSFTPGNAKRIGNSWALKQAPVLALAEERKRKARNGERQS
jgi:hypothetical protein